MAHKWLDPAEKHQGKQPPVLKIHWVQLRPTQGTRIKITGAQTPSTLGHLAEQSGLQEF